MKPPLAAALAIAYGAGLATGLAHFPALACVALAGLALVASRPPARWIAVAAWLAGVGAGHLARSREQERCAARLPARELQLAVVTKEPVDSGGARGEAVVRHAGCRGRILVRWPAPFGAPSGASVTITGRWRPRTGAFGRPGGVLVVRQARLDSLRPTVFDRLRNGVHATALRLYGRRAALVDALLIGRRGDLAPEVMDAFAASGLVHLLSISGFHLGVLAAWAFALLRLLGTGRDRAGLLAAAFAVLYTLLLGWPAPAARAAALLTLLAIERARQRTPHGAALLATTALAILLVDPWAVLDLGGWLSVAALGGAMGCTAWSDHRLGRGVAIRSLAGSVGATLATAPITASALGTVALAGILLNLVAVPLAALVVPALAASLLLGTLVPAAGAALAAGTGLGLGLLQELARWGAALPGLHLVMPASPASALPWLAVLLAAGWSLHETTRGEALRRLGLLLALGSWAWLAVAVVADWRVRPDEGSDLALHFLDVGQGDALAIRTPGGHWLLVDAGPLGPTSDAGRSVVVPFLRRHGVRRLDAIIVSHAHADHLGGVPSVLDRFAAGEVMEPAVPTAEPLYAEFLGQLDGSGTPWIGVRRGDAFTLDGVEVRVMHPDPAWSEWGLDLNESSVVVALAYRDFRAVLAGDAGFPAESALAGRVGRVDLLKVGHHGSRGATGARWLEELRPQAAVISVGDGNRYGHPAREALARLAAAGVQVFRTDRDGTVDIRTDGSTMTIRTRHGAVTRTVSDP